MSQGSESRADGWQILDGAGFIIGGPFASEHEAVADVRRIIAEEPSTARRLCPLIVCFVDLLGRRLPTSAFYPPGVRLPQAVGEAQAQGDVIAIRHTDGVVEVWGPAFAVT